MQERLGTRSNSEWTDALRSGGDAGRAAAEDLRAYLRRTLSRILAGKGLTEDDVADLTQDALVALLERLDGFRGDSAFTTWATAVATRTAFTRLRRRAVRRDGRSELERAHRDALAARPAHDAAPVDELVSRGQLLEALDRAIDTCLTERQRVAILAELRGIPTVAIAERLGTTTNALYKLVHDARRKLRAALLAAGFEPEGHDGAPGTSAGPGQPGRMRRRAR